MKFIKERLGDYQGNCFLNQLATASKQMGILEAKIESYQFNSILVPMLHKKEALSSMYIEGTQATISDVFANEITPKPDSEKVMRELSNNTNALLYGAEHLRTEGFSHSFVQKIHEIMLSGIVPPDHEKTLGTYKQADNRIVNSVGTVVFTPPSHTETKKYMDELIDFMNDKHDNLNPLVKAAITHSQFESIHPFFDGNGRVGRVLCSLFLYKSQAINFPFFYISEAISQDKFVYYNMLTDSRSNSYDKWIGYFLNKITAQAMKHIAYIDSLNQLFQSTKIIVQKNINSPKFDAILESLFTQPILTSKHLADKLNVSQGQAVRYLNILEKNSVLMGDDKKRNRSFYFTQLLDLATRPS